MLSSTGQTPVVEGHRRRPTTMAVWSQISPVASSWSPKYESGLHFVKTMIQSSQKRLEVRKLKGFSQDSRLLGLFLGEITTRFGLSVLKRVYRCNIK